MARWPYAALAAATFALHAPFLTRYGYHGDELYFLSCGLRPEAGYVDHAPLVPLLAALANALFPDSLPALRTLALLAGTATVLLTARLARALGGGSFAMLLAGLAVILSPFFLRTANLFAIPSFEPVLWTSLALVLVRILRAPQPRLWLLFGALAGIGLLTKHTLLLWGFGLTLGLLATRHRRCLMTRGPWLGAAIALLCFSPNLVWQAAHGWPTWDFASNLNATTMARIARADFLLGQALYSGPQNLLLTIPGLAVLLRRDGARVLGIAFLAVLGALLVVQSKIYYSLPAYPPLFAAGAVSWESLRLGGALRALLVAFLVVVGGALAPLGVPMLRIEAVDAWAGRVTLGLAGKAHEITGDLHGMLGWPELAHAVRTAYEALPDDARARALVVVGDYATAGALERFGPARALPPILCNHMSWHLWSRRLLEHERDGARNGDVVLFLGRGTGGLERLYERVDKLADVPGHPQANRGQRELVLSLCTAPRQPLIELWPTRPSL
jgi:hypothetical protein